MNSKSKNTCFFSSTIGRKEVVAITGLGMTLFVLSHMLGNMLILVSPKAYNEYGHALISNPLIEVAEAGLVLALLFHVSLALLLALRNAMAKGRGYAVSPKGDKATSCTAKTMWMQGLLIFVFVVLHLATFKYGAHYVVDYGKGEIRDLHKLVIEVFSQPGYVVWYVIALIALGMHLSYGVSSLFQTLGVNHPKYNFAIKAFGKLYAAIVLIGFLSQPIYVYFFHQG